jgi:hypothetical protein
MTYEYFVSNYLLGWYIVAGQELCNIVLDDGVLMSRDIMDTNYDTYELDTYVCDLCSDIDGFSDPMIHWKEKHEQEVREN